MSTDDTQVLDDEWVTWIAENLLKGEPDADIAAELQAEGLTAAQAAHAIEGVRASPVFQATRSVQVRALRAEMILRLERKRTRSLEIETMDPLDAELFQRRFRGGNRPVLLPTFARDWPALGKWSMTWFAEHFGGAKVHAMFGRDSDPDYDRNHAALTGETTIAAVIERIERESESNDFYVVARDGVMRDEGLMALHEDITPPPGFFTRALAPATALWLGPAGTITPLHHDQSDILFTQLVGKKHVRLIAPAERAIGARADGLYGPDLADFERDEYLKDVRIHDVVLAPGDSLFIPFGWWHHITALDPAISIAINAFEDAVNPWYRPGSLLQSREAKSLTDN